MRSRDDDGKSAPLRPAVPAEVRRAIGLEADFRCAICLGTSSLELHHIVPFAKSGKHEGGNLILLCATCHGRCDSGEISRKDLRAVKRRLKEKWNSPPIDDAAVRKIVATTFSELFTNLQPGLERLRQVAADHHTTVGGLVQEVYGASSSQVIMAALDSGDYQRAQELFRAKINEEEPIQTLNAWAKQPLALASFHLREEGIQGSFQQLRDNVEKQQVIAGSVGRISLANAIILTQEIPDQYMSLPFLRLDVLGLMHFNVPSQDKNQIIAHLVALQLAYESRVSDVDYDYLYFHKFTLGGIKFRRWLLERYQAESTTSTQR